METTIKGRLHEHRDIGLHRHLRLGSATPGARVQPRTDRRKPDSTLPAAAGSVSASSSPPARMNAHPIASSLAKSLLNRLEIGGRGRDQYAEAQIVFAGLGISVLSAARSSAR
jgi:hypothetical protein